MLFIRDKPNNFQAGLEICGLRKRKKNQLFIPIANLTSVQRGMPILVLKYTEVCAAKFKP
jgi:hypothetical protein